MPEPKRPLKVFLCHAHADRDAVRTLYTRLTKDGVDAWLDEENLLPGQAWRDVIEESVRTSDIVIVCLSNQSVTKEGFVQKEIKIALDVADEKPEDTIFVIPARLDECVIPRRLKDLQWVDLYEEGGYLKLLKGLKLREEQLEKGRIEKEEIKKRRLPYFETPIIRNNVTQRDSENSTKIVAKPGENIPLRESLVKPESREQPSRNKSKGEKTIKTEYIVAIIGATATIIAGILSSPLIEKWFSPVAVATKSATATITLTSQPIVPSNTIEPSQTPTESFTLAPPSLPTEITDAKGVSMVLVPAGEFIMGSDNGQADEKPAHQVYLDAFYMDKYEVTNAHYQACVNAGACFPPSSIKSFTHPSYFGNQEFDNYPVIWMNWNMARTFCEWRGGRLPTEAEWEKAARGLSASNYPWGNELANNYANLCDLNCSGPQAEQGIDDGFSDISPVGFYSSGISPYGAYDMSGNVMEWVADFYDENYYATLGAFSENPKGPSDGMEKVLRGGSWHSYVMFSSTFHRGGGPLDFINFDVGFRCARDVNP
jgi:formylglycine-generating enzyme required for sulfatase activity